MDVILTIIIIYVIAVIVKYLLDGTKTKTKYTSKSEPKTNYIDEINVNNNYSENDFIYDSDSWEGTLYDSDYNHAVSSTFRIKYTDSNGNQTDRDVLVKNIGSIKGKKAIFGYCKMRESNRTFIISKISECIDLDTGEFIDDIYDYLFDKYNDSPEKSIDEFDKNEKDILNLLAYIGRADGQFKKEEKRIIHDAIKELTNDNRITYEAIDVLLKEYGHFTLQSFKLAVGRISKKDDSTKSIINNAARKIVDTQKTISPREQEALDYISKRFYD